MKNTEKKNYGLYKNITFKIEALKPKDKGQFNFPFWTSTLQILFSISKQIEKSIHWR